MTDCIFCKIADNTIEATIVYQDEQATAFRDINPAAPTHILIVPNKHIESVNALEAEDEQLMDTSFLWRVNLPHRRELPKAAIA